MATIQRRVEIRGHSVQIGIVADHPEGADQTIETSAPDPRRQDLFLETGKRRLTHSRDRGAARLEIVEAKLVGLGESVWVSANPQFHAAGFGEGGQSRNSGGEEYSTSRRRIEHCTCEFTSAGRMLKIE